MQDQEKLSRKDPMLGACNGYMKRSLARLSHCEHGGVFGEVFIKQVLGRAIKKDVPLEEIKIVIIQLKWNAQGKGMILIGL